jgi:putative transposase
MKNCEEKGIYLRAINGYTDHLHCLLSLRNDQTIAKVSQLLKGESSFWINKSNLMPDNFSWQDDYFAVSVSESQVKKLPIKLRIRKNTTQKPHSQKKLISLFQGMDGK